MIGTLVAAKRRVKLLDLNPGLFLFGADTLCMKTEYGDPATGGEAYIISTGEAFWGGVSSKGQRARLLVTPVKIVPGA